jgi:hypothetical protein
MPSLLISKTLIYPVIYFTIKLPKSPLDAAGRPDAAAATGDAGAVTDTTDEQESAVAGTIIGAGGAAKDAVAVGLVTGIEASVETDDEEAADNVEAGVEDNEVDETADADPSAALAAVAPIIARGFLAGANRSRKLLACASCLVISSLFLLVASPCEAALFMFFSISFDRIARAASTFPLRRRFLLVDLPKALSRLFSRARAISSLL